MLMSPGDGNTTCVAFSAEWNPPVQRSDLADLTAFIAIADA
jgi:hypothetical protein